MDWLLILVVAAAGAALTRIYTRVRKIHREQGENWDAKLIERMRRQGSDPFKSYDVVFFFAMPNESASGTAVSRLEAEGFAVDVKRVPENTEYPFSLRASKSMRLSVPEMKELSRRFGELARAGGGRYDGWTA